MTGLRKCLEQDWDATQFAGSNFDQWDRTLGLEPGTTAAEAERVKSDRLTRSAPNADADGIGEGK